MARNCKPSPDPRQEVGWLTALSAAGWMRSAAIKPLLTDRLAQTKSSIGDQNLKSH